LAKVTKCEMKVNCWHGIASTSILVHRQASVGIKVRVYRTPEWNVLIIAHMKLVRLLEWKQLIVSIEQCVEWT